MNILLEKQFAEFQQHRKTNEFYTTPIEDLPPCPYCGSPFKIGTGHGEFTSGCPSKECPEHPSCHDPVGRPDYVEDWWWAVQQEAPEVKKQKREQLETLQEQVKKYYQF